MHCSLFVNLEQMEHMGFLPFKDEASSNRFKRRQTSSSKLEVASTQDIGEQKLLKLLCKDFHDRDSWLREATSVLQIRTQVSMSECICLYKVMPLQVLVCFFQFFQQGLFLAFEML